MAVVSTGQITITDVNDYTYQGTTAPKNPIPNVTVWIDTSVSPSVMKRWTGTAWEIINEVKVGFTNLILNSKNILLSPNDTGLGNSVLYTNESDNYYRATPNSDKKVSLYSQPFSTKIGDTYIMGIYVRHGASTNQTIRMYEFNSFSVSNNDTVVAPNVWTFIKTRSYISVNSISRIILQNISSDAKGLYLDYKKAITVQGNRLLDWIQAPEDVNSAILNAQNSANTANNLLADIANDNILTPSEKQSTKKEWDIIVGEKTIVESQANSLGVSATSYVNAYNSLNSYITPLLANLTVNSAIVGSDFRANFKNYYDTKIALLKAVTDKLKYNTDNIQVGGRNLILNSDSNETIILYGVTATYENVIDSQLPSKQYFKFTNVVRTVGDYVFFIPTYLIPEKFSQSLVGKKIQISFYIRTNNSQKLILEKDINQNFMIDNTWQKVRFNIVFNGGNLHFFLEGSGLTSFDISSVKIEFGDVATDWTPAPEDIDAKISAEAQKVIDLENKTDFLTGTAIEGNAVATGTLLVGNSDGTNAGLTGLGNTSDGVYLWGGGTYQQMVQGLAKKEQRRNGIDVWRHPNGQIGFEIGIKDGRLIFNGYHSSGFKLFELDPNRGLVNVAYTPESWTETPLRKLTYSSSTFNESSIASEIQGFLIKNSQITYISEAADSEFVYVTTYSVTQNGVGYDYDNGTNPANSSYESLKGMKANNNDRYTNIANGWYMSDIGEIYSKSEWNSNPPLTYTFSVYVYYYQDGKITQTKVVTVTK